MTERHLIQLWPLPATNLPGLELNRLLQTTPAIEWIGLPYCLSPVL